MTLDGTLALRQTTMPDGMVVLIDGASLTGTFASTTGLVTGLLISQAIAYNGPSGEVRLVTIVTTPEPTGCVATPSSPLADGGTLTCISATPITEAIATSVDGVTIVIGQSGTPTTVMTGGGVDALSASIAGDSAAGNISINSEFGIISGGASGIVASTAGTGSITITGGSVTGNAGDGISANSAGGDISISGAHTVLGTGGRGIEAISVGGDISIQGVGATNGVTGTTGSGIHADATGGTGGNINIGDTTALGAITGNGNGNSGISAITNGADRSITIDASGGAVMSNDFSSTAISAANAGTGASSISITTADVTAASPGSTSIGASLSDAGATGAIIIDSSAGAVSVGGTGIFARNSGSGTTTITTASVTSTIGFGIITETRAGATIIVNAGGTVSGAGAAIRTTIPDGVSATPADSVTIRGTVTGNILTLTGADSVTLADTSVTTGITIDLGEGDDTLDLASVNFGTFDGGDNADTLSVSGTGIDLGGSAHSNFETLIFATGAGSNTLSGTHTGLTVTSFGTGTTTLTGSLTSITAAVASGAMLDLADGSSLAGNLSNRGMLTLAGAGFGTATVTGNLRLNAGGTLSLDTNGAGGETDLLMVSGAVTLGGTLALTQTTMPDGTVVLIDGASLSGTFASTTGLIDAPLIRQAIAYDGPSGEVRLITTVLELDPAFPTGCVVTPTSPLADGGTLTCISGGYHHRSYRHDR